MPSIKELRIVCQGSRGAPSEASQTWWGRLNRVFSVYLTWLFIRLPFTPNQITVAGTALFVVGAGLFAAGHRAWNLVGAGCIVLAYLLDAVDGELARYRGISSRFDVGGVYVEPVSHDVQYGLMFLPIAFGVYEKYSSPWVMVLGATATAAKLLFRLLEFRLSAVIRHISEVKGKTYGWSEKRPTPTTLGYRLYRNLFVVTGMIPFLLIASAIDRVEWFVYFYGVTLPALWIFLFARHVRRVRGMLRREQHAVTGAPIYTPTTRMVVFDFDGTIVETMQEYADIAAEVMRAAYGVDRKWARRRYLETSGVPFFEQVQQIFPNDERNERAVELFEHTKLQTLNDTAPTDEVRTTIEHLRAAGLRVAISSNNFHENVERTLIRIGLPVDCYVGWRQGFAKGEAHFAYLTGKFDVLPVQMLFVGDSVMDGVIAARVGVPFIGKTGTFTADEFTARLPGVKVIETFGAVYDIVCAPAPLHI